MAIDKTLHIGVSEELYAAIKTRKHELLEREGVEVTETAIARSALETVFLKKEAPAVRRRAR